MASHITQALMRIAFLGVRSLLGGLLLLYCGVWLTALDFSKLKILQ